MARKSGRGQPHSRISRTVGRSNSRSRRVSPCPFGTPPGLGVRPSSAAFYVRPKLLNRSLADSDFLEAKAIFPISRSVRSAFHLWDLSVWSFLGFGVWDLGFPTSSRNTRPFFLSKSPQPRDLEQKGSRFRLRNMRRHCHTRNKRCSCANEKPVWLCEFD
jgi:hypothetical protein